MRNIHIMQKGAIRARIMIVGVHLPMHITTYVVSFISSMSKVYLIQMYQYVINFVTVLPQVSGFLQKLQFSLSIKLTVIL